MPAADLAPPNGIDEAINGSPDRAPLGCTLSGNLIYYVTSTPGREALPELACVTGQRRSAAPFLPDDEILMFNMPSDGSRLERAG
jgi:hypothetical protein